jgi:hypothetical protein
MISSPYGQPVAVRRGPSARWYLVGAALIVLCAAVAAAQIVSSFRGEAAGVAGMGRVAVPGFQQLYLAQPQTYTIYYETPGAPHRPFQPLQVQISDPQGNSVEVHAYPASRVETYQFDGFNGTALGTFRVERPGLYDVSTTSDQPETGAQIAVGNVGVGSFVLGILAWGLFAAAGCGLGALVAALTFIRRLRARGRWA